MKEYLIANTNWLCQCDWQKLKRFRCLICKCSDAFSRQFELDLKENEIIEALINLFRIYPEEFEEVDYYRDFFLNILLYYSIYNKKNLEACQTLWWILFQK